MKVSLSYLALSLAFIATSTTAFANTYTVYQSTGTNGEIRYTQTAPKGAKNVEVLQIRNDGRQNTPGEMAPPPVNSNETTQSNQAAELERRLKDMEDRDTAQRCRSLRNNLANFKIGGKLYQMDDSGNRTYLSSQEIDSRRETTQQMINQFCGSDAQN